MSKIRLGFVPSHRYPADEDWAVAMRRRCVEALSAMDGVELVVPGVSLIHNGLVRDDVGARAALDLFASQRVQGIIIGAMTVGDQVSAANVAEGLDVPVMVFGTREGDFAGNGNRRSDAFAGALAITAALHRRRIPFLFAGALWPEEPAFSRWVGSFARACAAVDGFIGARVGLFGLPSERVETLVANETALSHRFRQHVIHVPMYRLFEAANSLSETDHRVVATVNEIKRDVGRISCTDAALLKAARLEMALLAQTQERGLSALAVSCAQEPQEVFGICPCSTLGRLTQKGLMSACEADVYGALSMLAAYLAALGEQVPCPIEWAAPHQELENVVLAWQSGSAAVSLAADPDAVTLREQSVMSQVVGPERAQGAVDLQFRPGPVTFLRLAESDGEFRMLITKGEVTRGSEDLSGAWGWVRVADLGQLYRALAEGGFGQYAVLIHGDLTDALEAFCRFLGIQAVRV